MLKHSPFLSFFILLAVVGVAQERPAISIRQGPDGKLAYTADAAGNRVIDFSAAGYAGGGEAIPFVPVKITVAPNGTRDGERIQAALDLVAAMPTGADGFRGAVLLAPGRFRIEGTLRLNASGVVLRGSGPEETGTVLIAAGNSRRTLIEIGGRGERRGHGHRGLPERHRLRRDAGVRREGLLLERDAPRVRGGGIGLEGQ